MNMLWLKGCPRCGGDLHENQDVYGYYISCLQCGYYLKDAQAAILHLAGSQEATVIQQEEREVAA